MILREPCPVPSADAFIGQGERKPDSSQGFRFPTRIIPRFETKRAYFKPKRRDNTRLPAIFAGTKLGNATRFPAFFSRSGEQAVARPAGRPTVASVRPSWRLSYALVAIRESR